MSGSAAQAKMVRASAEARGVTTRLNVARADGCHHVVDPARADDGIWRKTYRPASSGRPRVITPRER